MADSFASASAPTTVVESPTVVSTRLPLSQLNIITPDEFNSLKFVDQRKLLVQNANQLRDEFLSAENGDAWVRHLLLADIVKFVGEGDDPPSAETRQQLSQIADLFDATAANPAYRDVVQPVAFRVLHVGLREFSTEPVVHLRRLLTISAQELSQKMAGWENGDRWQTYLRLDSLLSLDDSLVNTNKRLQDMDALQAKFERVETDATFEVIRKEEAFQHVRMALQWYITELRKVNAVPNQPVLPNTLPLPQ